MLHRVHRRPVARPSAEFDGAAGLEPRRQAPVPGPAKPSLTCCYGPTGGAAVSARTQRTASGSEPCVPGIEVAESTRCKSVARSTARSLAQST